MKQYLDILTSILEEDNLKDNRTVTPAYSSFLKTMSFNLQDGFPLVTTKFVSFKNIKAELSWFLSGSTNINDLDSTIWDEWADENGDLGPIYGKQWSDWDGINQIGELTDSLIYNPDSRRHILSAWNVSDLPVESKSPQDNVAEGRMALAPCHILTQFYVNKGVLSASMYQRSCDMFLGVPYNIASYALLLHYFADYCGYEVGTFNWIGGDCHIYENHVDQVKEQIGRTPLPLPTLDTDSWELINYISHPSLIGKVAV